MPASRACLVTGYVRLNLGNRRHDEYTALGSRLLGIGHRTVAFLDPDCRAATGPRTGVLHASLPRCWLWPLSAEAATPAGNPEKDTRAYHAVQHQKTAWLAEASQWTDAEILVWLDFGILHVPGITEEIVAAFLERAGDAPTDRIGMASIWGPPAGPVDPSRVAWHCAGGVLVVPRDLVHSWHIRCQKQAASLLMRRGMVTWEVNTWAEAWRESPDMVRAWACDHDASLLEAGP